MDEQDKGTFDPLTDSSMPGSQPQATAEQDYAAASRRAGSFVHEFAPQPKAPIPGSEEGASHRNLIISLVALVALALAAAGVYWFIINHKSAANFGSPPQTAAQQPSTPVASQIDATIKSYTSPNFKLTFSYPADWTLTDNGGGVMTVKSPLIQLKNTSSQSLSGAVLLTIRDPSQKLVEFNSGNATAVRDSVKIAYANPTSTQRANTYVSFLQYATTRAQGALDGIYITGDSGYQKGQAIPLVDVQKVDPVINLTFFDANGKQMSITNTMWDDQNFSGPLAKMLQSFSIT